MDIHPSVCPLGHLWVCSESMCLSVHLFVHMASSCLELHLSVVLTYTMLLITQAFMLSTTCIPSVYLSGVVGKGVKQCFYQARLFTIRYLFWYAILMI